MRPETWWTPVVFIKINVNPMIYFWNASFGIPFASATFAGPALMVLLA
jgi:hypothetical protein